MLLMSLIASIISLLLHYWDMVFAFSLVLYCYVTYVWLSLCVIFFNFSVTVTDQVVFVKCARGVIATRTRSLITYTSWRDASARYSWEWLTLIDGTVLTVYLAMTSALTLRLAILGSFLWRQTYLDDRRVAVWACPMTILGVRLVVLGWRPEYSQTASVQA